jgi:hypothetical protein
MFSLTRLEVLYYRERKRQKKKGNSKIVGDSTKQIKHGSVDVECNLNEAGTLIS